MHRSSSLMAHGTADALRSMAQGRGLLAALTVVTVGLVATTSALVPAPLLLPTLSLAALGLSGLVAMLAWRRRRQSTQASVTLWDVAGALALIGFIAGTLSDPQHIVVMLQTPIPAN